MELTSLQFKKPVPIIAIVLCVKFSASYAKLKIYN